MNTKRILSMLLALCMVFSLALPGVAFADDDVADPNAVENNQDETTQNTQDQGTTYYTVSFDANGGVETYETQSVKAGDKAVKPSDPTQDGFTFDDWYEATRDEGNGEVYYSKYDFELPVNDNLELVALWNSNIPKEELNAVLTKQTRSLKSGNLTLGDSNPSTNVAQIGEDTSKQYPTLDAAYEEAKAGETIKLLADITYGADREVPVWDKSVNIDLNGKTLTTNSTVNINASNNGYKAAAICFAADDGSLTISNGTIKTAYGAGVYVAGHEVTLSNLTINAATEGTQSTAEYSAAVRITSGGKVIIKSGSYSGAYAVAVSNSGGEFEIENGTFNGNLGSTFFNISTNSGVTKSIAITGGTFTGDFVNPGQGTLTISGGTFNTDPSTYVAGGYVATQSDNVWKVSGAVAQIGTTKYATLAEALKAANSGDTIKILAGSWGAEAIGTLTTQEALSVRYKSLTIQPAEGTSVTFTSDVALGYDDSSTANASMTVKNINFNGAKLSLGNYVQATVENCSFSGSNATGALVIIDSCCKNHRSTGEYLDSQVTVRNCAFNGITGDEVPGIRLRNTGNVTLEGNTVENTNHNGILIESNGSIDATPAKTISITGNTITEWNSGNATGGGRAIRLALGTLVSGSTVTIRDNYFTKANVGLDAPDFVKITEAGTAATVDLSHNYWNDQTLSTVKDNGAYYSSDAGTTTINSVICKVAQIGTTKYETLADAIAAVPTGDTPTTITMIADSAEPNVITIPAGKNIVLDLNGKTVSHNSTLKSVSFITNKGTLTVQDNSTNKDGKITMTAVADTGYSVENITVYNLGGTLNLQSGTIENNTAGGLTYAVNNSSNAWGNGDDKNSVFNMTGGKLSGAGTDNTLRVYQNCAAGNVRSYNTVNISGGVIENGIFIDTYIYQPTDSYTGDNIKVELNILNGATINGLIDLKLRHAFNTSINISGGDFTNAELRVRKYTSEWNGVVAEPTTPLVTISGGKFAFGNNKFTMSGWNDYAKAFAVSGGVFNVDLNDYSAIQFPEGKTGVPNTDESTREAYPYTVGVLPVAEINGTKYTTLAAAIAAANESGNCTITIQKDIDFSQAPYDEYKWAGSTYNPLTITASGVTIDLNNHKLYNMGNCALVFGNILANDGRLASAEIKNGRLEAGTTNNVKNSYVLGIAGVDSAKISNVTTDGGINVYTGSNVAVENCTVNGTKYYALCTQTGSTATITGSTFTKNTDASVATKAMFWVDEAGKDSDCITDQNTTGAFGASSISIASGTFTLSDDGAFHLASGLKPVATGGTYNFDAKDYAADGYDAVKTDESTWVVQQHEHTFDYDKPNWSWKVVNGVWSATVSYPCTKGDGAYETVEAEMSGPVKVDGNYTYTATDPIDEHKIGGNANFDTKTVVLTYTVTYDEKNTTFKYGEAFKAGTEGGTLYDWYVKEAGKTYTDAKGDLRAKGTSVFYLPVVANATVTKQKSASQTNPQVPVTSASTSVTLVPKPNTNPVEYTGTVVYHVAWSLPQGAQITSEKIYRGTSTHGNTVGEEKVIQKGAQHIVDLNVRNGDYTYTVNNVTVGKDLHLVLEIKYTLPDVSGIQTLTNYKVVYVSSGN